MYLLLLVFVVCYSIVLTQKNGLESATNTAKP
jgi:Flp pilus assembly protein TadG